MSHLPRVWISNCSNFLTRFALAEGLITSGCVIHGAEIYLCHALQGRRVRWNRCWFQTTSLFDGMVIGCAIFLIFDPTEVWDSRELQVIVLIRLTIYSLIRDRTHCLASKFLNRCNLLDLNALVASDSCWVIVTSKQALELGISRIKLFVEYIRANALTKGINKVRVAWGATSTVTQRRIIEAWAWLLSNDPVFDCKGIL